MKINEQFLTEIKKSVASRHFTPSLFNYLVDFLETEKVRRYGDQYVINTFIPPFPGPAFDRFLAAYFNGSDRPAIQSVDLAVTNGCVFNCWHCYNAGRRLNDLPAETLKKIIRQLQETGAIVVNFTGGEPCLRHDLADLCASLREDSCGILATTGYGFTDELARRLRDTQVYSISISLDSADELEHDRKRGVSGAFKIALQGIETALKYGYYTYTCAVPTKTLLRPDNFENLVDLNRRLGVHELQLIEPAPAGKLGGRKLDFGEEEVGTIFQFMAEYNRRTDDLAISSFAHMESPEFFGCGAGHSHIYIDGTGEVSPCNMIPVTYGNAAREELAAIINRMQQCFRQPCRTCLAYDLQPFFTEHAGKGRPIPASEIPPVPFPETTELPGFFQVVQERKSAMAGADEIVRGYTDASVTYEDYWLSIASGPIDELFCLMTIPSGGRAIDCGCGTGYSTAKLAESVGAKGHVLGIDLTPGMIAVAEQRIGGRGQANVEFRLGDVRELLAELSADSYDIAVLSWLVGYVGCEEIFPLLNRVIRPGGAIGFVAHLDRSPLVPMEVFEELAREEPDALLKIIEMKFPADCAEVEYHLQQAGFRPKEIRRGTFMFTCHSGQEVYDHIMKSGAGTTFYYSLRPSARKRFAREFIRRIERQFRGKPEITITHEYVIGLAVSWK